MDDKIRILAVDDEKFNLTLLKGVLKPPAYEIVGFTNALDALLEFKKNYYDLLLLDVIMPGIDGFELRKLVREYDSERPIIFLTSMVDDFNATMLNQIASDPYTFYISKSFTQELLKNKIAQAVGVHRNRMLANDYSRKLETELVLAGDLQKILLPNWCEITRHMICSALYLPANKVSGDLFEIFHIVDAKYLFFIGDIAGHGISAALYMSAVLSFLKITVNNKTITVNELLNKLNEFFCNELSSGYMTCLAAIIDFDANHIVLHSAGHPGLVGCTRHNEDTWSIGEGKGSIPIGWFPETVYREEDNREADFNDDTIIMAWSDGVLDIANAEGASPEPEDFLKVVGELSVYADPASMPSRLIKSMEQLGYNKRPDDICVVALQKRGADPDLYERLIPPQISKVSEVAMEFSKITQDRTGDFKLATKVELLVHEFLNNVILHGGQNKKSAKERIYISLRFSPGELVLRGMDRGIFYDDAKCEDRRADISGSPTTSGRGLEIIKNITSRIRHTQYCGLNETVFFISTEGK